MDEAGISPWPVEVDEEVIAARGSVYESFDVASHYVQSMWCRVAEAKGSLQYHGTDIDLDPVIDLLQLLQRQLVDHGLEFAGAAQQAVYEAWFLERDLHRQRRRSLVGALHGAFDPEVAHVG